MSNYSEKYLAARHPFKSMTLRQAKKQSVLQEYLIWLIKK